MKKAEAIIVSAPCKVHLLGEHSVVYGKPAILTTVDLRVTATIIHPTSVIPSETRNLPTSEDPSLIVQDDIMKKLKKTIEPIIKKHLKIKKIPPYQVEINSQAPIGSHLGTSAAVSATYITALLSFLKIKWDLNLINDLTYEAEKTFQGNPSGGDNSTVVYGGLIWFRKESEDLKIIQQLPFTIPPKLAKNFIFINTGKPNKITADMVKMVRQLYDKKPKIVDRFLQNQEQLVKDLLSVIKEGSEKQLIKIIREGEKNLESIGVCSLEVKKIIREIEAAGGAAKICGAGAFEGPTGILLCYHKDPSLIQNIAKSYGLSYFKAALGVEGLRQEKL